MLKEKQLVATEYGQTILVTALLLDFVTMILLTVLVTMVSGGNLRGTRPDRLPFRRGAPWCTQAAGASAEARSCPSWPTRRPRSACAAPSCSSSSSRFSPNPSGVEVILGAFLAGAIVSLIAQSDETSLHLKLDAIGFGFLVPIFFIMVGAEFDLAALLARPESVVLALAILLAAYVVKVLPAAIFGRRYGLKESLALGVLVTPGLSLAVAAAEIGFRLELLTASTHSAMILLAILTAAISPVVFERMVPHAPEGRKGAGHHRRRQRAGHPARHEAE